MKKRHLIALAILALLVPSLAMGQNKAAAQAQTDDNDSASNGQVWGNYTVRQTIEFGGRIADNNGNQQMYDTLVNLKSGPRLLGQELSMRSNNHDGSLFDNLYLSSFGLGGDPNDMIRLRVEKNKWYNFVGLYRRDENFFDYNLFGNPLNLNQGIGVSLNSALPNAFNPTTMPWYANSPHLQDTVRHMGDFNLTLFPQSAIRFRLGYAHNNNAGTIDTTLESPRTILTEYSQSNSDRYTFGVDVRPFKRTTFSFDEIYEHDKIDPNYTDGNLSFTVGPNGVPAYAGVPVGTPIDLGLFLPPSGCTTTNGLASSATTTFPGGNVFVPNSKCSIGLLGYNRSGQVRTSIPTSQLSVVSNYFRKLDITASGSYSSGDSNFLNYSEFSNGFPTTSLTTGSTTTDRVSGNADLGLTYHISKTWSVSDKFRWIDWRDPGNALFAASGCSALAVPGLTAATAGCTLTPTATGYVTYIGERTYNNTAKLNWVPSRRISAYLGYRYERRELTGALQGSSPTLNSYFLETNGVVAPLSTNSALPASLNVTKINEQTALGGVILRPTEKWRINADTELMYADNAFTNIAPRHQQRVRVNTTYKVNRWASVTGGVHLVETRNDFAESVNATVNPANPNLFPTTGASTVPGAYGHQDHWRYYTLGANLNPNRRLGFDFGYTYLDQSITSATCMPSTGPTVQATPALCNGFQSGGLPLILNYQERTNSAFANLTVRPMPRVALSLGYDITSTAGQNNWTLPGGSNGTGILQMVSDIYGNSPPLAGNPLTPCPAASTAVTAGCAFAGPFPDAPFSQGLNYTKVTAGIAVNLAKGVMFKGSYAYYDYDEKDTVGLPLVTLPQNFHANTGTVSLRYTF
jgi:opacity protein-like surface antigen